MLLNIGIIIVSPIPSFLHHHCLHILYTPPANFLRENVFNILFHSFFFFTTSIPTTGPYVCMTKSSCLIICLATHLYYICSCSTSLALLMHCSRRSLLFRIRVHCTLLSIGLINFTYYSLQMTLIQIVTLFITAYTPPL